MSVPLPMPQMTGTQMARIYRGTPLPGDQLGVHYADPARDGQTGHLAKYVAIRGNGEKVSLGTALGGALILTGAVTASVARATTGEQQIP